MLDQFASPVKNVRPVLPVIVVVFLRIYTIEQNIDFITVGSAATKFRVKLVHLYCTVFS